MAEVLVSEKLNKLPEVTQLGGGSSGFTKSRHSDSQGRSVDHPTPTTSHHFNLSSPESFQFPAFHNLFVLNSPSFPPATPLCGHLKVRKHVCYWLPWFMCGSCMSHGAWEPFPIKMHKFIYTRDIQYNVSVFIDNAVLPTPLQEYVLQVWGILPSAEQTLSTGFVLL